MSSFPFIPECETQIEGFVFNPPNADLNDTTPISLDYFIVDGSKKVQDACMDWVRENAGSTLLDRVLLEGHQQHSLSSQRWAYYFLDKEKAEQLEQALVFIKLELG